MLWLQIYKDLKQIEFSFKHKSEETALHKVKKD